MTESQADAAATYDEASTIRWNRGYEAYTEFRPRYVPLGRPAPADWPGVPSHNHDAWTVRADCPSPECKGA